MEYQANNGHGRSNVAVYGMLLSICLVMGYLENLIPIAVPVPGIKPGFSNIVIIWVLYSMGIKYAIMLSAGKILLCGFLFGNLYTILFSFAGAVLSLACMILLKHTKKFSMTGVSIAGGVCHNIGQIIVAVIVLENSRIIYYLPFLMISGIVFGVVVGIISGILYKRIKITYH